MRDGALDADNSDFRFAIVDDRRRWISQFRLAAVRPVRILSRSTPERDEHRIQHTVAKN